jgi:predicted MPP superfamily phosphohydrolase
MTEIVRVLHISDLHLTNVTGEHHEIMVSRMIDDVVGMGGDHPVDLIVFSGDLSAAGQPNEFSNAQVVLFDPLVTKLQLDRSRVVIVPGNHDIDRSMISMLLEPGLREIGDAQAVTTLMDRSDDLSLATRRLDAWTNFHSDFYRDSTNVDRVNPLSHVHRFDIGGQTVGVAALNSAWRATGAPNNEDHRLLIVGADQARQAMDAIDDCGIRLVTFHHPLDWLAAWDHSELREELERRGTIVLTGHDHEPDPTSESTTRGSAIYDRAGCLYGGREFQNGYSLLDVSLRDQRVDVHLRTWMPRRKVFDKSVELAPEGMKSYPFPDRTGSSLSLLPKYTTTLAVLANAAQSMSVFADQVADVEPASVADIVVEPRFYPAPFTQVAAAIGIARSQGRNININRVNPLIELSSSQVVVVSGDPDSGVTNSLLWILEQHYYREGSHSPIYTKFRSPTGRDSMARLIRSAGPQFGLQLDKNLGTPLIIALDDISTSSEADLRRLVRHISEHPENLYVLGCHGAVFQSLHQRLGDEQVRYTLSFLGPFGRDQLKQLVLKISGDVAASRVDHILEVVFGENLPRNPFLLVALIAVLSAQHDTLWVPKTSSGLSTWTFVGVILATKMERGALLPLHCLRPHTSVGPSLSQWTGRADHRDRHAPPRGCRLAPAGGASGPATSGSGSARWIEPTAVDCSPGTLLRPAGDSAALASRARATEVDLPAPAAWTTGDSSGHGLSGPSSGKREPYLGISPNPWGDGHDGSPARSFERVGDPSPAWHRPYSEAFWPDLGTVPAGPGTDHAGLRLLHRRHGAAQTPLRPVLHRARHPKDLSLRDHRPPGGGVGRPAGSQPHLGSRRALPSSQVPRTGQRYEVHFQFRRGVSHRGCQDHQDSRSSAASERIRRAIRGHSPPRVH